jgi:glutamate formiminotransferase
MQEQQQQPHLVQQCWQGSLPFRDLATFPPDAGPVRASPRSGVITIGATPWVVNFNVPVTGGDLAAAKQVARAVSTRGGGLPALEVSGAISTPLA